MKPDFTFETKGRHPEILITERWYIPCDCMDDEHFLMLSLTIDYEKVNTKQGPKLLRDVTIGATLNGSAKWGPISLIWERIKNAWRVLLGKDYYGHSVCLDRNALEKLRNVSGFLLDNIMEEKK